MIKTYHGNGVTYYTGKKEDLINTGLAQEFMFHPKKGVKNDSKFCTEGQPHVGRWHAMKENVYTWIVYRDHDCDLSKDFIESKDHAQVIIPQFIKYRNKLVESFGFTTNSEIDNTENMIRTKWCGQESAFRKIGLLRPAQKPPKNYLSIYHYLLLNHGTIYREDDQLSVILYDDIPESVLQVGNVQVINYGSDDYYESVTSWFGDIEELKTMRLLDGMLQYHKRKTLCCINNGCFRNILKLGDHKIIYTEEKTSDEDLESMRIATELSQARRRAQGGA